MGQKTLETANFLWSTWTPSTTSIPQPTLLTAPNGIRIQSAVLPQYYFQTDRQTHRPTHGIGDVESWHRRPDAVARDDSLNALNAPVIRLVRSTIRRVHHRWQVGTSARQSSWWQWWDMTSRLQPHCHFILPSSLVTVSAASLQLPTDVLSIWTPMEGSLCSTHSCFNTMLKNNGRSWVEKV